jgi:hypothetical protein
VAGPAGELSVLAGRRSQQQRVCHALLQLSASFSAFIALQALFPCFKPSFLPQASSSRRQNLRACKFSPFFLVFWRPLDISFNGHFWLALSLLNLSNGNVVPIESHHTAQ